MSLPAAALERSRTQLGERGGRHVRKPVLCTPSPGDRGGQTHTQLPTPRTKHTGLSQMCFLFLTHNAGFDGLP